MDQKKAFDTVDYKIILHKLGHCGFCGVTLEGQTQTTQIAYISKRRNTSLVCHKAQSWAHNFS